MLKERNAQSGISSLPLFPRGERAPIMTENAGGLPEPSFRHDEDDFVVEWQQPGRPERTTPGHACR